MRKNLLLFVAALFLQQALFAIEVKEVISAKNIKMLGIENNYLKLDLLPSAGGRIMNLIFKPSGVQLTNPNFGCFTDNIWNIESSRFFLKNKAYQTVENKIPGGLAIEMKGNAAGGGIDFLEVGKTFKVFNNSAAVSIDYRFRNMPQAMTPLEYGFWFHNTLGVIGEDSTYYYPCDNGIIATDPEIQKLSNDRWFFRPARGWCAVGSSKGNGVAMVMDFSKLKCFYSWYGESGNMPSLEWRFEKMTLKESEVFSTQIQMIPFYGLPIVSGAGQDVVGALVVDAEEIETDEIVPINISLYSAIKQDVDLEVRVKRVSGTKWSIIGKGKMIFDAPATLKTMKLNYKVLEDGGYSLEVIVRKGKKELGRLNNLLICSDLDRKYKIAHLKKKLNTKKEKIDLAKYDLSKKTEHIKWAKPYCKGKIKVLALTGYQNISEVAELAQRLSIEPHVSFLSINQRPIFLVGDDYGQTTQADIIDSLNMKLKSKYDVILIGGVPWNYFPKGTQNKIIKMVKNGTGLVYIDPTGKNEKLERISPLFNPGAVIKGVPNVIEKSFLTSGIPFDLFSSNECRKFQSDGNILVKVSGSPYMATKKIGKGNVVALAYKALGGFRSSGAGLTPELRVGQKMFLNSTVTQTSLGDYWEYYFSLLAKSVVYAADRLPPVEINTIKAITKEGKVIVKLELSSDIDRTVSCNLTNLNRYSTLLKKKNINIDLNKGENNISLEMDTTVFEGQQMVNIIIKDQNNKVLNWGSVGAKVEPSAKIAGIDLDKKFYKNGEAAKVTVKIDGALNEKQTIICELFDSYRRCLFSEKRDINNPQFSIPLNNQLLSRFYTLKVALNDNGREIDLLEKSFVVTPSKKQLIWDDYEPGIWITTKAGLGMRPYLLPQLSEKLHELKINTIIANFPTLDLDFAIRNNFNPTALKGMGLSRSEEPKAYLETGDKLKLVRTPCLSDPVFLNQRKHSFSYLSKKMKKYALRFYWLGDEQSITGYGGKPIDFCLSKFCLAGFRKQLKNRYKTLDKLNEEWESDFKEWDTVLPMTRQEAWKCPNHNVAPWAEHLNFMDSRLESMIELAGNSCRKNDPNTRIFISGTQAPTAYGGMDWWRQMKWFDGVMNYNEGGQRDLQRSFKPNGDNMHWGMGYSKTGGELCYAIWESLFMGEKGVMGFHSPSLINPDMTFSNTGKDALIVLKDLTEGIGKHYINNLKAPAKIAILYSQPSIRAAFINKQREEHSKLREKYIDLCRNTGVNFNFISYEQLANGILAKSGYKVLILPNSAALSKEEISAIRNFAMQKNVVMAEGNIATMDEHCRPFEKNSLSDIFDNERCFLNKEIDLDYNGALLYPNSGKNIKIIKKQQLSFLNYLKKVGIKPLVLIIKNGGEQVMSADLYQRKDSENCSYISVITKDPKPEQVTFKFPKKAYIYELRAGKKYGYTDSVKLFLSSSKVYVFALLEKEVGGLSVDIKQNNNLFNIDINIENGVDSVVNMQVVDPLGKTIDHYMQNIILKNGKAECTLPFALNDKKGTWRLKFKDVVTGQTLTKSIKL